MNALDLHASVRALRDTADTLEEAAAGAPRDIRARRAGRGRRARPLVASDAVGLGAAAAPGRRSVGRLLVATAVHTSLTVAVLTGVTVVVDPLLPHAERPELSGPVVAPGPPVEVLPASPPVP